VTPRFPRLYTAPSRGPTQQRCHEPSPGRARVHAPRHLAALRLQARDHPVLSTTRASPATPPFTPAAKSSRRRRTASCGGRSARAPPSAAFSATLERSRSSLPCEPSPPPLPSPARPPEGRAVLQGAGTGHSSGRSRASTPPAPVCYIPSP
jgi:hypothetical protein